MRRSGFTPHHCTTHTTKSGAGFTLIELLLSVALIGLISGTGAVVFQQLQNRNSLDTMATSFATSSRRAQALSRAAEGDTTWGVRASAGAITVFQGASYASRNATFDEVSITAASISPSGMQEVTFSKLTGLPQATGTLTLTGPNDSRTITINAQGTVIY